MAEAIDILTELKRLIEQLPLYAYERDWEKAKEYYLSRIQSIRSEVDTLTEDVVETERRVSRLKSDVVALENA
jgi:polyhydroxyalkanoate synthesis regulator phasin